jgi:hypothetical protein
MTEYAPHIEAGLQRFYEEQDREPSPYETGEYKMATQALQLQQDMNLSQIGQVFAKSGFFEDSRDAAQAIVKVMAGAEMGFPPVASMVGVYIVKGKPSLSANMMASMVKRSGKYNYRVRKLTEQIASIEFFEQGESIGTSDFTIEDAKKAGTQNIQKFARNMLYARAMSNGVKWFCPDLFGGPIYTPDELGAQVDSEGDAVPPPRPAPAEADATVETVQVEGEQVNPQTGEVLEQPSFSKEREVLVAQVVEMEKNGFDNFQHKENARKKNLGPDQLDEATEEQLKAYRDYLVERQQQPPQEQSVEQPQENPTETRDQLVAEVEEILQSELITDAERQTGSQAVKEMQVHSLQNYRDCLKKTIQKRRDEADQQAQRDAA